MFSNDFEPFRAVMEDLCVAFNRPKSDEVIRVFYESLKWAPFPEVKRAAESWRRNGKKFPSPKDLAPEKRALPPKPKEPEPVMSKWAVAANRVLLQIAYQDEKRGFRPIAKYEPKPERGYGLPVRATQPLDDALLRKVLAVKREYVEMAESADLDGAPMGGMEFSDMCREGFARVLS